VNLAADLAGDDYLRERGYFQTVPDERTGQARDYPGAPFLFNGCRPGVQRPPAPLGRDNRALWVEELGMSEDEFAALGSAGLL
jgi:crotonobetainyl-CoA:carnitine CoA-transferase CaiB-like acyl-CoA transferase